MSQEDEIIRLLRSIDVNSGYPTDTTAIETSLDRISDQLASIDGVLHDVLDALSREG
jgi:hypothetical protein